MDWLSARAKCSAQTRADNLSFTAAQKERAAERTEPVHILSLERQRRRFDRVTVGRLALLRKESTVTHSHLLAHYEVLRAKRENGDRGTAYGCTLSLVNQSKIEREALDLRKESLAVRLLPQQLREKKRCLPLNVILGQAFFLLSLLRFCGTRLSHQHLGAALFLL